ncbi:MAG: phosphoesterase [Acidobacteriota bacterium]|nr:phosphoesterase [Acidobacteriota bacterium]
MAATKKVLICFHDKCFDGASSAAFFTRWYRSLIDSRADISYRGLFHRAGQLFDESMFTGDENVIVDFKYSSSERLTWWFDHHQSAFLSESDAEHFRRDASGRKFYDPEYRSCTKLISHIAGTKFGFHSASLDELVYWADLIDGAQYPDAKTAVDMKDPAMQITLVVEGSDDRDFVPSLIPRLAEESLGQIASSPAIKAAFERLYARHLEWIEIIRRQAELKGGVLFFDVTAENREGYNKFIPYYLFPEAIYTVSISRSPARIKIGVGSSPWNQAPSPANLASICERFGGGGHAKVAAISLPPGDLDGAREASRQIVEELRASLAGGGGPKDPPGRS